MVKEKLVLHDQLKDYADRGEALVRHCLLDFFIDTYEGDTPAQSNANVDNEHRRGRWWNVRVPYTEESGREEWCRIMRSEGHKMLPNFVGQWFPRKDDPDQVELYTASMLVLLQPWSKLQELKSERESFTEALARFNHVATPRALYILDNIQYHYKCLDRTGK